MCMMNTCFTSKLLNFEDRSNAFVLNVGTCSSVQVCVLWNPSEHQLSTLVDVVGWYVA